MVTAKSCCHRRVPAQHPPRSNVSAQAHLTGFLQIKSIDISSRLSMRCSACCEHSSVAPNVLALNTGVRQAFSQASQGRHPHAVDVVLITRPCPFTFSELAYDDEGSGPCSHYPDADVYMRRCTYNDLCENIANIQCPKVRRSATQALQLMSENIHMFEHSWTIAPELTVSSIVAHGPTKPSPFEHSTDSMDSGHATHALLCDDSPVHIVSDAPVMITKGAFVGCTDHVGDPWFKLNHEVDQRAGAAGRAKLLKTVATGGDMHVFHDSAPDNGSSSSTAPAEFLKVEWHAAPAAQRFCPCS